MELYLNLANQPSPITFEDYVARIKALIYDINQAKKSLSLEERRFKRKMGPRHFAYAMSASRLGLQYEAQMPRDFDPVHFKKVLEVHNRIAELNSLVVQLAEATDDYLMGAGIDAMLFTKVVHDSLRIANMRNPQMDAGLAELDEYNRQVRKEEEEDNSNQATQNPTGNTP